MKERKRCLKCGKTGDLKTYSGTSCKYHQDCHGTIVREFMIVMWVTDEELELLTKAQKFALRLRLMT